MNTCHMPHLHAARVQGVTNKPPATATSCQQRSVCQVLRCGWASGGSGYGSRQTFRFVRPERGFDSASTCPFLKPSASSVATRRSQCLVQASFPHRDGSASFFRTWRHQVVRK